ncbi:hypothetical protein RJ639_041543 [Escallonia herrerae]|uniref:WAT1-related protein n=1 Tax=Escallonia herrerae TaxID=1293975 RepID=A0AA88WF75_9ASTE|nr:hypothetical protein RJ639_041543 [Escallonia herrerae]
MNGFSQTCLMGMEKHKPYIAMVIIQFIYTGMALLSKASISAGVKPSVFVAYRQALATLFLAPFALYFESQKSPPLPFKLLCKIFFVSVIGVTASQNLNYMGLNFVSATVAIASTNAVPTVVFILAVCFGMEGLSITHYHGMAKMLGSVIVLSGAMVFTFIKGPPLYTVLQNEGLGHSAKGRSTEDWIKGSCLQFASTLTWSVWLIMQRPIIKQYPAKLRLTTMQCCFSCIGSAIWGAGIVVTAVCYWLQVWVVDKKGPVFTAMFSPLALVLTAIISAILFKETLHWGSVCGALLLVMGLYSFLWGKKTEAKFEKIEQKTEQIKVGFALECITSTSVPDEQQGKKEDDH